MGPWLDSNLEIGALVYVKKRLFRSCSITSAIATIDFIRVSGNHKKNVTQKFVTKNV